jgi:LuxR family maltose regulon positive regulatory protein
MANRSLGLRAPERHPLLTRRQLGILKCLQVGMRPAQVAETLHLAMATVRMHIRDLNTRLGTHSYFASVTEAQRRGLLGPSID